MKKITFLLFIIFFVTVFSLQAQKQFSGEIRFQTKLVGTTDPNLLASMDIQFFDVSILGNKSKTVFKNEMLSVANIWDGDKEIANMVIEVTGMGKYYKKWTTEQWKDKLKFSKFSFQYENDFKTICDYKCQKVVVTITNLEDDSTEEQIYYITKEIGSSKLNGEMPGLEGYPLMVMSLAEELCEGCYRTLEAVKITPKKLKEVDFLLPSNAKSIDESPELKQMLRLE